MKRLPSAEASAGTYYAHVPTLGLTTHGVGVDGALEAARDLIRLWTEEKKANGEPVTQPGDALLATVEVG